MWGVSHLAFLPAAWQVAFLGAALWFCFRPPNGRAIAWIGARFFSAGSGALLVAVATGIFLVGQVAVPLLGDGLILSKSIPAPADPRVHAPLVMHLSLLLEGAAAQDPADTFRFLSIGSGVLSVILAWVIARAHEDTAPESAIVVFGLLFSGFVQLFFGYIETYPPAIPAVLLYLHLGLLAVKEKCAIWAPAVALGAIGSIHYLLLALLPSLLAIPMLRPSEQHPRAAAAGLGTSSLAIAAGLLALLGADLQVFAAGSGKHMLPLFRGPGYTHAYTLFSPLHLVDIANLLLLVAPAAWMIAVIVPPSCWLAGPKGRFLALAAAGPLGAVFLLNPEIGAFRDWDLFAFVGVPLTLLAIHALNRYDVARASRTALPVLIAAGLHTAAWVSVNAGESRAVNYFRHNLESHPLSTHAHVYGWESLSIRYKSTGELEESLAAIGKALQADPSIPRLWNQAGVIRQSLGDREGALQALAEAARLEPTAEAYANLGRTCAAYGEIDRALHYLELAVELQPNSADILYSLAGAHLKDDNHAAARAALRRVLQLRPDHPRSAEIQRAVQRLNAILEGG